MKKLIEAIINKYLCAHKWSLIKQVEVYDNDKRIGYKYVYECKKCGKMKIVKTY